MAELPPIDMDATTSLPPINTSNLNKTSRNHADYAAAAGPSVSTKEYQEKAIAAIARKKQRKFDIPKIDFTQHQLENGDIVSTNQRVVKDVSWTSPHHLDHASLVFVDTTLVCSPSGSSSCDATPDGRRVLFQDGPFETRHCLSQESLLSGRQID